MKKRVFILLLGVILSCGITAGILTSGFAAKYMMKNMIELLNQKKIDKMSFPESSGTVSHIASVHSDPLWKFEYLVFGGKEMLQISFYDFEADSDVCRLFNIIQRNGLSNDGYFKLKLNIDVYDKNDMLIVSHDKYYIYALPSSLSDDIKTIFLTLIMGKDSAWDAVLGKYNIGKIRIIYGNYSFILKLDDNSSPYSTIEQIKQLSFWVKCPENQLNDIGKKYDVWN